MRRSRSASRASRCWWRPRLGRPRDGGSLWSAARMNPGRDGTEELPPCPRRVASPLAQAPWIPLNPFSMFFSGLPWLCQPSVSGRDFRHQNHLHPLSARHLLRRSARSAKNQGWAWTCCKKLSIFSQKLPTFKKGRGSKFKRCLRGCRSLFMFRTLASIKTSAYK